MVNGATMCGLVAMALYAMEHEVKVPEEFTATHESGTSRLTSNMLRSAMNSKINRSMDDTL